MTERHPFWSVDREAWVAACELIVGERLLERDGIARVATLTERDPEPVYNLEVDGDHCYRVGERGVLVHNASTGCSPCDNLRIGIDASGKTFDKRKWKPKTVTARDERGPRFTTTRDQIISVDVVDYAIARLRSTSGGTKPDNEAHAWVQCLVGVKLDDAGHVIGKQLGGKGELAGMNIFPQNFSRNRGTQSKFETDVVKPAVAAGKDVCILIKLNYSNASPDYPGRPTKVLYYVWIDGVLNMQEFDNDFPPNAFAPSTTVNYCSDTSR